MGNLMLLNMLLAIVIDHYTEVRGEIGSDTETMFSQAVEIFKRWRGEKSGEHISMSVILKTLDPTDLDETDDDDAYDPLLNVKGLMECISGLREAQDTYVLVQSRQLYEADIRGAQSITDAVVQIPTIAEVAQQVHTSMQYLIQMTEMNSALTANFIASTMGIQSAAGKSTRKSVQAGIRKTFAPDAGARRPSTLQVASPTTPTAVATPIDAIPCLQVESSSATRVDLPGSQPGSVMAWVS